MDTLTIEDKITLARNHIWSPQLDRLLRKWKRQISKRQEGHADQGRKFSRRHYIVGLPATLLGAVVATGVLSTFRNCSDCDDLKTTRCRADQWIRLGIGLLSVISVCLFAIQTFFNYQELSEKHKNAAGEYENLHREIETLLQIPGVIRGDPIATLHNLRDRYTTLARNSPSLPKKYSVDLTYTYSGGPKPPTPEQINVDTEMSPLKKLLKGKRKAVQDDIDIETGFDLDFDLDSTLPYSCKKAALTAAKLAAVKEEQIQRSVTKALEVELLRLDNHMAPTRKSSKDLISRESLEESSKESSSKEPSSKELDPIIEEESD